MLQDVSVCMCAYGGMEERGIRGGSAGIRWGSSGDPHAFRGIRHDFASVGPTFRGDPSATTLVFYNIKKGSEGCMSTAMYGILEF